MSRTSLENRCLVTDFMNAFRAESGRIDVSVRTRFDKGGINRMSCVLKAAPAGEETPYPFESLAYIVRL